jgi:hypothetical protein
VEQAVPYVYQGFDIVREAVKNASDSDEDVPDSEEDASDGEEETSVPVVV